MKRSIAISKALIVGGGIGGLTAAIALRKQGVEVDVVEIKPDHHVLGVGILQPGNALRALNSLDLMQECLSEGFQTDEFRYFDARENLIAKLQLMRIADPDHPAINMISRPALHRILSHAAERHGANVRMGATVDSLDQDHNCVHVVLTDGSHQHYDIVVGADGIYSNIRERLFGKITPRFTGHATWRYATKRPKHVDYQCIYLGVGVKAGLVPLDEHRMYTLLVTNENEQKRIPKEHLWRLFRDNLMQFGGDIANIRDELNPRSDVVYTAIEEVILPEPWHQGRVILIGDAAHASSPHIAQGAAMAVEDAVVLGELVGGGMDVSTMFDAFMKRRFQRCKFVQDTSRAVGNEGNLEDPVACEARNERYRALFANPQSRPHEQMLAEPL